MLKQRYLDLNHHGTQMKKLLIATIATLAVHTTIAAPAPKPTPTETLQKAVSCDLPEGKFKDVVKAIKALKLKAKPGSNFYAVPVTLWGREASGIAIDDQDVETYSAMFNKITVTELAAAAGMKTGEETRRGKHGSLLVAERDGQTWAMCTVANDA